MKRTNWYKVDNVAKVFLATVSARDTRSLRVSCTLKEEIDPELLKRAVLLSIQDRPQVQVRIHRGLFWHYMEDTDKLPEVYEEKERVCPLLYIPGKDMLHYQVTYFGSRINLDMCHVLSDGTGALEFLNIIVLHYLKLKYPGRLDDVTIHSGASAGDLSQDSYRQFFENKNFSSIAQKRAYHPGGLKLPYDQLQFFEIHIPSSPLLQKAKELKVSLTSYIGAVWMLAILDDMPSQKRKQPITVTLPVNLRNYYPSQTSRNFFNNVNITHVFEENISLEDLAKEFDASLKARLNESNIKDQMNNFETMEYVMPVRTVPLFIKQIVVRHFTKQSEKNASMVLSNMGVQKPPTKVGELVSNYSVFCSSNNLFVAMSSFEGELTLGVTSPYMNSSVIKSFVRYFSSQDVEIRMYATEVIEE